MKKRLNLPSEYFIRGCKTEEVDIEREIENGNDKFYY